MSRSQQIAKLRGHAAALDGQGLEDNPHPVLHDRKGAVKKNPVRLAWYRGYLAGTRERERNPRKGSPS